MGPVFSRTSCRRCLRTCRTKRRELWVIESFGDVKELPSFSSNSEVQSFTLWLAGPSTCFFRGSPSSEAQSPTIMKLRVITQNSCLLQWRAWKLLKQPGVHVEGVEGLPRKRQVCFQRLQFTGSVLTRINAFSPRWFTDFCSTVFYL